MRRYFKFKTGLLLMLVILLSACDTRWQKYNNQEYGFSILLPGSWEKEEGVLKSVVMAMAPVKDKRAHKVRPNLNVFVTQLPEDVGLDVIFELNKEELAKSGTAMINQAEGEIYAGSLAGKWLSFEGFMRNYQLRIISALWVKGRRVYTVTCTSLAEESSQYEPVFRKVLRSLRVK
jgi:hypothetical protein